MTIRRTQRWTWRTCSRKFGDALGGRDRVNSETHLQATIEWVWRCTWRPRLSELIDALAGHNQAWLEMHFLTRIVRTWRPWSSEFCDAFQCHDHVNLDAMIEGVWRYTWRPWSSEIGRALGGGRWTARRDSIHQLVDSQPLECATVTLPLKRSWRTGWWRSISREVRRKRKLHSGVNSKLWEWRDDTQS